MKKMRRIAIAVGACAVLVAPMSAAQATTVGGQTFKAGGCDITAASVTWDPIWGQFSFTGFSYTCD